ESFDRAWRRVGVAIDSAGFTVEDRDRSQGDYFIRYLDADLGEKIEQQNFFGRLFGGKNTAEPVESSIHVQDHGGTSLVTVHDMNGAVQDHDTAKRHPPVLARHMSGDSAETSASLKFGAGDTEEKGEGRAPFSLFSIGVGVRRRRDAVILPRNVPSPLRSSPAVLTLLRPTFSPPARRRLASVHPRASVDDGLPERGRPRR